MNKLKASFLFVAIALLSSVSSASAQSCYTTLNAANTYFDQSISYPAGATLNGPLSYQYSFPTNNRIKTGGISMFWRLSTDGATVQRAITTLPGYKSFTKTGEGTYLGKGSLSLNIPTTKGTYFLYYKFQTQRGDASTAIQRMSVY